MYIIFSGLFGWRVNPEPYDGWNGAFMQRNGILWVAFVVYEGNGNNCCDCILVGCKNVDVQQKICHSHAPNQCLVNMFVPTSCFGIFYHSCDLCKMYATLLSSRHQISFTCKCHILDTFWWIKIVNNFEACDGTLISRMAPMTLYFIY